MIPVHKQEELLQLKYSGQFVKYSPIGKQELYGKIDRITLDSSKQPVQVIFIIDSLQYKEEVDDIDELLTLL